MQDSPNNEEKDGSEARKARVNAGMHNGQANRLVNIARRMQVASVAPTTLENRRANGEVAKTTWHAYGRIPVRIIEERAGQVVGPPQGEAKHVILTPYIKVALRNCRVWASQAPSCSDETLCETRRKRRG